MDELKVLKAFIRIIEIARQIEGLAWKQMAPYAIKEYAEEIRLQVDIITEGTKDEVQ